jgi:hypothetical protein
VKQALSSIEVPIAGRTIWRCYIDHRFGLVFPGDPENPVNGELAIGGAFSITDDQGTWTFSPSTARHAFGRALDLFGKVVQQACAFEDGALLIRFSDGTELHAAPDEEYETWEFVDSANHKLVSMPGGGLARWNL